ncbi:MAG: recombinase XerD [Cellulosilyticum sp.]|nr:recombinase XerD [Cellulosilyticum sp.]
MSLKANVQNEGIYLQLLEQIQKIYKHNRQGSYKTKERYYEATKRFCMYLADQYCLQKFENVKSKHLISYTAYMQQKETAAATIKTDLAAIRFYHDQSGSKNNLVTNEALNLEKRKVRGINRAWTQEEFERFQAICTKLGKTRIKEMALVAMELGFRIHEVARIDKATVEQALRNNMITIKGKGGKIRNVELTSKTRELFESKLKEVERGAKIFVNKDEKTDEVINKVQEFIIYTRHRWQEPAAEVDKTFHGLRHTYARKQYEQLRKAGENEQIARKEVSRNLGHNRIEVTKIYTEE